MTAQAAFIDAFHAGDFAGAKRLVARHQGLFASTDFQAHPILRSCVSLNQGHCHRRHQLRIAELLLPSKVRRWRTSVIQDAVAECTKMLQEDPSIVSAEFTAGRGIGQAIHHFVSVELASLLLSAGADIDAMNSVHDGETALALKIRAGDLSAAAYLLDVGADPNVAPKVHIPSPQLKATIDLLLCHGWNIEMGNQILHDAKHGHGNRVAIWLSYGVSPNTCNQDGSTPLHLLAASGRGVAAVKELVAAGADVNARDNAGLTALAVAEASRAKTIAATIRNLG